MNTEGILIRFALATLFVIAVLSEIVATLLKYFGAF
jgi:hypothetical protein